MSIQATRSKLNFDVYYTRINLLFLLRDCLFCCFWLMQLFISVYTNNGLERYFATVRFVLMLKETGHFVYQHKTAQQRDVKRSNFVPFIVRYLKMFT